MICSLRKLMPKPAKLFKPIETCQVNDVRNQLLKPC